jgi:asparaginyl-tRNA synthetase
MPRNLIASQKSVEMPVDALPVVSQSLELLSKSEIERKRCIGKVMTYTLKHLTFEFVNNGFEWLLPVILSKSTDPLWPDPGASIAKRIEVEIYGETVRPMLSMIVHKMVACSLAHPKLFILSPNIRVEKSERATSGVHAYEFTQFDFEIMSTSSRNVQDFVEEILYRLIAGVKKQLHEELIYLRRYESLKTPSVPFKVHDVEELQREYGADWQARAVEDAAEPFWIVNIPREFYDFEDFEEGRWDNYDLMLPNYGEVLSGSRREWEYSKIVKKMERDGVSKNNYETLLKLAREGKLKPSAGAGIGVERLVSWIVGAKHIGETQLFPKIPGIVNCL